jgi:F5/8 type C domain
MTSSDMRSRTLSNNNSDTAQMSSPTVLTNHASDASGALSAFQLRAASACTLGLIAFLLNYVSDGMRPGANYPLGWYGVWYDQSQYYDMVVHIPKGTLGNFQYPPVYPFLGFLGQVLGHSLRVFNRDPFFFVDLGLFLVFIYFAHRVFERFLQPILALAASVVLVQASVDLFVTPWTTTVSAACMVLLLDIFTAGRYTVGSGVLAGLAAASMFGARLGDAVLAAAVGLYIFVDRRASRQTRNRFAISAITAGALVATAVILVNLKYSGLLFGNYFASNTQQGFTILGIPTKIYGYLIDPFVFHSESNPYAHPIVSRSLFLLLAPLGFLLLMRGAEPRKTVIGPTFLLALTGWALVYVPFVAVTGHTLRYGSQHYIKPILPLIIGAGFYAVAAIGDVGPGGEQGRYTRRLLAKYLGVLLCVLVGVRLIPFPKLDLSGATLKSNLNPAQLRKMIDGDMTTRWDSAAPQQPGMEFDLDLGKTRVVQRIVLNTEPSPNDYPRKLSILYSYDGKTWTPWSSTDESGTASINDFRSDPRPVRGLKFIQEGAEPHAFWSVHELSLYGW